jgi:hypothetical protein
MRAAETDCVDIPIGIGHILLRFLEGTTKTLRTRAADVLIACTNALVPSAGYFAWKHYSGPPSLRWDSSFSTWMVARGALCTFATLACGPLFGSAPGC